MGSSILGTSESLMVAYANLAPSGDHQWATCDWKISSGRVKGGSVDFPGGLVTRQSIVQFDVKIMIFFFSLLQPLCRAACPGRGRDRRVCRFRVAEPECAFKTRGSRFD